MSGMDYAKAVRLLRNIQGNPELGVALSGDMWKAIIDAVTDETAVYDPMIDPDFSLDEIELAEKLMEVK